MSVGSEQPTVVRKKRPNPKTFRFSDEDADLLRRMAEDEQRSQATVLLRALHEYAKKHFKTGLGD